MIESENPVASPYQLIGPSEDGTINNLLAAQDAKSGRQRLQALITEWLRMENLVVLAGAGTSVSSGGKTMASLEHAVLATIHATPSLPASISAMIAARIIPATSPHGSCKLGFEDWLSYLANAVYLGSAPNSPFTGVQWQGATGPTQNDLSWFVDYVGRAIFMECALSLADTVPLATGATDIAPHLAFLAKLVARDSNLGRAHLFTLNYDTLFEQALELLGIQYFDGFTGRADARFDPSVYGLDMYYPGEVAEGRVRRFDKFLHLYKLHGSIHWRVQGDELRARHPDLSHFNLYQDLTREKQADHLMKMEQSKTFDGASAKPPTVGILPIANKFVQTLTMPFAHLFRAFQIRLSAPQTFLLVLGYGFGDDHVNRIIETALMNPSLVMLVVEPNPNSPTIERIRRYKELGKRAFILTPIKEVFDPQKFDVADFTDFARSIMPDVQWLDDFLRLRRFEKQIHASQPSGLTDELDSEPNS
jgi:hypothetical protein